MYKDIITKEQERQLEWSTEDGLRAAVQFLMDESGRRQITFDKDRKTKGFVSYGFLPGSNEHSIMYHDQTAEEILEERKFKQLKKFPLSDKMHNIMKDCADPDKLDLREMVFRAVGCSYCPKNDEICSTHTCDYINQYWDLDIVSLQEKLDRTITAFIDEYKDEYHEVIEKRYEEINSLINKKTKS